jgi:hypothetical protein
MIWGHFTDQILTRRGQTGLNFDVLNLKEMGVLEGATIGRRKIERASQVRKTWKATQH